MAKRIIQLVDDAYEDRPTLGRDEYISVLKEAAKGTARRYRERKDQRDTETTSICSSRPSKVARAMDTYDLHRRTVETESGENEVGPESLRMEIMIPSGARTGITGTTSPKR